MATTTLTERMREALRNHRAFPTFDLTIGDKTFRVAEEHVISRGGGPYVKRIPPGGFGEQVRAVPRTGHRLIPSSVTVQVEDVDRVLLNHYDTVTDVEGARGQIVLRSEDVPEDEHWLRVSGVVDSYPARGRIQSFLLTPEQERRLRSKTHIPTIQKKDFPGAPEESLGKDAWVIYGEHISQGRPELPLGVIKALQVDATADNNLWLASYGRIQSVPKVWRDGVDETNNWSLRYELIADRWWSLIEDTTDTAEAGDDVRFDAVGFDGDGTGSGTLITNPAEQLEHFLTNLVFGDYTGRLNQSVTWLSTSSFPISTILFSEAKTFFTRRKSEGSRVISSEASGLDVLTEWCENFNAKPFWSLDWKLAVRVADPTRLNIVVERHLRSDTRFGSELQRSMERQSKLTRAKINYLYDTAAGSFSLQNEVHDTRRAPAVEREFSFFWGRGRV